MLDVVRHQLVPDSQEQLLLRAVGWEQVNSGLVSVLVGLRGRGEEGERVFWGFRVPEFFDFDGPVVKDASLVAEDPVNAAFVGEFLSG